MALGGGGGGGKAVGSFWTASKVLAGCFNGAPNLPKVLKV